MMDAWDALNPLDWSGTPFLLLYGAVAGTVLLLLRVGSTRLGPARPRSEDQVAADADGLDVLHVAYLAGGAARALDTAMLGLFLAGGAVFDRRRAVAVFQAGAAVDPVFAPFRHGGASESGRSAFHDGFADRAVRIRAGLARRGLVPSEQEAARFQRSAVVWLCAPLALGILKVAVGLSRDRPVGFLLIGLVVTGVFGWSLIARPPSRNRAGTAVLAWIRERHARAIRAPLPHEVALAFALTGNAALAGAEYASFFSQAASGDGSTSSSDGGSDGGGGCGGCSG